MTHTRLRMPVRFAAALLVILLTAALSLHAQTGATLSGTVVDAQGRAIPNASITVKNNATGAATTAQADAAGNYTLSGLADGAYTITATATGFGSTVQSNVSLSAQMATTRSITLNVGGVTQEVTVNATADSIAAKEAPSGGYLEERTPQSLISPAYLQNFVSPVADYAEMVNIVPGAYSVNSNGIGLGQAKTYFRGFPDGDYDIDFDGIPFYDTNTPTHHSWAFFPTPEIGSVDFERGPGTAASTGPTPFGGSIHLFSRTLPTETNIRGTYSIGSWNTQLLDGSFDSGEFGPGHANMLYIDVQRMMSDGYESYNYQEHDAGMLKYQHRFGSKYLLTGLSAVDHLNSNTPNFNGPTRAQIATNGPAFLLTDNSDPTLYTDYQYNFYKVPTDFEYVGLKAEPWNNWLIDAKAYTYDYYNGQHYANAVTLTPTACAAFVVKKGISALPCGVDKLNSYRKAGENLAVSGALGKHVTLRTGVWYEWAHTYRYQFPSNPLANWADQTLPNFAEEFITQTAQPYAEVEYRPVHRLSVTAGAKLSYTSLYTTQYSDDGKTIGTLPNSPTNLPNNTGNPVGLPYIHNGASWYKWLPSIDANYRLSNYWSVYGQASQGSIVPPSSVFDLNHLDTIQANLKQSLATTYQGGTSVKLRKLSLDADYYLTRFQGSYASVVATNGDTQYVLQPDSTTKGFEGETTYTVGHGLSVYVNGTVGSATYRGTQKIAFYDSNNDVLYAYAPIPSGLWVANTPGNTEDAGLTYSHNGLDMNLNFKRVGDQWLDNSNTNTLTTTYNSVAYSSTAQVYHNQDPIGAIKTLNYYVNYTVRGGKRFDGTKIRFGVNNILNQTNIFSVATNNNSAVATSTNYPITSLSGNGSITTQNPFLATTAVSPSDVVQTLPGRSFVMAITFGFSPKNKKGGF